MNSESTRGISINCATAAHQIPFVSANMSGSFPVRIIDNQRLSKNMMPSLLHLCKVETGQEQERSSYRVFKFKKIVKSNAPAFELLAANRT